MLQCNEMTKIEEIEAAIEELTAHEIADLSEWLTEYQLMFAAAKVTFAQLDDEEGDDDQWQPHGVAKSGS